MADNTRSYTVSVEMVTELNRNDISELSDAAESAIDAGGGFGWLTPPPRSVMENYWKGILLIPDRQLFVGKLDEVIVGSCQIVKPTKNNEAQAFACQLTTFFLMPQARGYGIAQRLVAEAEDFARSAGFRVLNLDVRSTQDRAIHAFQALGYEHFGTNQYYALVGDDYVSGLYFTKKLYDETH